MTNIDSGLVAYYKLNQMDTFEGKSTVSDSSGNNRTGVIHGKPSIVKDDEFGSCIDLNGTADYVASKIPQMRGDFTVSIWFNDVRLTAGDPLAPIMSKPSGLNGNARNGSATFDAQIGQTHLTFFMGNDANGYNAIAYNIWAATLEPNRWYHFAATMEGNTCSTFVDGKLTKNAGFTGTRQYGDGPLLLGYYFNGSHQYFKGKLSHARVYNRALSAGEIAKLHKIREGISIIDSAAVIGDKLYVTRGQRYLSYKVDENYAFTPLGDRQPKELDTFWRNLPHEFLNGFDAMMTYQRKLIVTKGDQFLAYSLESGGQLSQHPSPASTIGNKWLSIPSSFWGGKGIGFDFMMETLGENIYVARGEQFANCRHEAGGAFKFNYQNQLGSMDWGSPSFPFTDNIDTVFPAHGKIYMVKEDQFLRYSDRSAEYIDDGYPQLLTSLLPGIDNLLNN